MQICVATLLLMVTAIALLTTASGCNRESERGSRGPTSKLQHLSISGSPVEGHDVKIDADITAGLISKDKEHFVQFAGHKLTIEKDRLLFDGKESVKIPAS